MIGMQYRIKLPSEYDMNMIRKRVADNGHKTDGFPGLLFKCYIIQEKNIDGFENIYAPLYIWKDSNGMNEFLFHGFYDNIIKSFGWQNITIGVPLIIDIKDNFKHAKFAWVESKDITPALSLSSFQNSLQEPQTDKKEYIGRVCIYNPDQWKYSDVYFYMNRPDCQCDNNIYQILHISQG